MGSTYSVPGLTHVMGPGFRVSDPTEGPGSQRKRDRKTDRQTDRQTQTDTDRQTERQTDRERER